VPYGPKDGLAAAVWDAITPRLPPLRK